MESVTGDLSSNQIWNTLWLARKLSKVFRSAWSEQNSSFSMRLFESSHTLSTDSPHSQDIARKVAHRLLIRMVRKRVGMETPILNRIRVTQNNALKRQYWPCWETLTRRIVVHFWSGLTQSTFQLSMWRARSASRWTCQTWQASTTCWLTSTRSSCKRAQSSHSSSALICQCTSSHLRLLQSLTALWLNNQNKPLRRKLRIQRMRLWLRWRTSNIKRRWLLRFMLPKIGGTPHNCSILKQMLKMCLRASSYLQLRMKKKR